MADEVKPDRGSVSSGKEKLVNPWETKYNNISSDTIKSKEVKCEHYTRLCRLKAVCCSKFVACRFCHDEVSNHEMDRHKVQEIQCVKCNTIQPVGKNCIECAVTFGEYFCSVCRLYDVDRKQFHCNGCGICRVGPKEKYFHCKKCNACLNKDLQGNHKCVENTMKSHCPVCFEYLHTSRSGSQILKCGHMMHQECLQDFYSKGLYQCPLCKESLEDMTEYWKQMDEACASVQLPDDLKGVIMHILCQDCHKVCDQQFNTEGLKCKNCGSYNTTQA